MKRIFPLLLLTVIMAAGIHTVLNSRDQRSRYEKYLLAAWNSLDPELIRNPDSIPKLDRPDMAALQDYYQILDPNEKRIPTERLRQGRQQAFALQSRKSSLPNTMEWQNISSDMGGRTRTLMWDPNDEGGNKVWAGAVTGGLWYNNNITDPASTWQTVSDVWPNLSISSIAHDPNNAETLYAGTGELETAVVTYRESSTKGVGIWKSEDGGESWYLLPATEDFAYVSDIVVKDAGMNQSIIFAGVGSGTYKSEEHYSQPTDGLYRSDDGGESWDQVLPVIEGDTLPYTPNDVAVDADGDIYVGTIPNINGKGGATILTSKYGDPGTWSVYDDIRQEIENDPQYPLPGRVVLAVAPSTNSTVYAVFAAGYTSGFGYYYGRYLLRSDNNGETWNEVTLPTSNGDWANLAWHALTLGVDPNDENHLFAGGLHQYHSINGGDSWYHVSNWALMYYGGGDEYIHADQHCVQFKPGSSEEVIFASDGGVFYTDNGAQGYPDFQERNHGFSTLQFYSGDIHPDAGTEEYIGGLQDNGSLYYQGDDLDINDMVSGGDGAFTFFDKSNGDVFFTSTYYNRYYVFDNGSQVNQAGINSGTFVCPADYDNNGILYANACDFFGNDADELLRIKDLPYGSQSGFADMNTGTEVPFTAIKVSQHEENMVYFGSQSGRFFRGTYMHITPAVEEITGADFPVGTISCIEEGTSADTLLVTFSNYGVSSVWRSFDAGASWHNIEGNLPDMPVRWAVLHPENNEQALLATELGVWQTNHLHLDEVEWLPSEAGMPHVRVDMLKVRPADNTVLAATHGRGLFTANYPVSTFPTGETEALSNTVTVYPNPAKAFFRIKNASGFTRALLKDMAGQTVYAKELKGKKETIRFDLNEIHLPKGQYLLILESRKEKHTQKIVVM